MKIYVEAKSKADLIRRLSAGEEITGYNYSMFGGGGHYMLDDTLEDGTVIAIYEKMAGGNPIAKSWGTWTNGVLKAETNDYIYQAAWYICVLCNEHWRGYGHSPAPLSNEGVCCDICNDKVLIARRKEAKTFEAFDPADAWDNHIHQQEMALEAYQEYLDYSGEEPLMTLEEWMEWQADLEDEYLEQQWKDMQEEDEPSPEDDPEYTTLEGTLDSETFESPVSCKICGKTFASFRGLNGHMNAHLPSHRKRAETFEAPKKTKEEIISYLLSNCEDYDEYADPIYHTVNDKKWTIADLFIRQWLNNGWDGFGMNNVEEVYGYLVDNKELLIEYDLVSPDGINNSGFPLWHNYDFEAESFAADEKRWTHLERGYSRVTGSGDYRFNVLGTYADKARHQYRFETLDKMTIPCENCGSRTKLERVLPHQDQWDFPPISSETFEADEECPYCDDGYGHPQQVVNGQYHMVCEECGEMWREPVDTRTAPTTICVTCGEPLLPTNECVCAELGWAAESFSSDAGELHRTDPKELLKLA
ncbi:MAG TPA: hypothetical protein DHN29_07770, partial [Cytophagales bacterium]|nr:hypothetical protein [Cytophagales bacterium]